LKIKGGERGGRKDIKIVQGYILANLYIVVPCVAGQNNHDRIKYYIRRSAIS
jgi:hypothetical protein